MANLTITVPDQHLTRVLNGFAAHHGYKDTLENPDGTTSPNPETKIQFARRIIRRFVLDSVKAYEAPIAAETARQTAIADVDTIVLT